jgi:hypothetical protein
LGVSLPRDPKKQPEFYFNAAKLELANIEKIRVGSGKNMMLLAQVAQTTYDGFSAARNLWWYNAVSDWSEFMFSSQPATHVTGYLAGNESNLCSGLRAGAGSETSTSWLHGHGGSPLVKFLMEDSRCGKAGLARCYASIKEGTEATAALIEATYDTEHYWLPDFYQQYLQGSIYNVNSGVFVESSRLAGTMNTAGDTLKEFQDDFPDLSAKLYLVDLSTGALPSGSSIGFEVDASQTNEDYVTTLIYRLKDNQLEYVARGLNVTVSGARELAESGYDLVACIVNASNEEPFTGSSPLELTVRVLKAPPFTWCRISVGLTVVFLDSDDTTHYEAERLEPRWTATGQMTENSFTWEIDSTYHGNTNTHGTMSVTIDPATMTVVSFAANATTVDAWGTSYWSLAGNALPQVDYYPNSLTCGLEGTATCSALTSFVWYYRGANPPDTDVVQWRCQSTAFVRVDLSR